MPVGFTFKNPAYVGILRILSDPIHPDWTNIKNAIEATGVTLTSIQKSSGNRLVLDMHGFYNPSYTTYDIWSKFYVFYGFLGGTAGAHKFNWINPVDSDIAYRLTFPNGMTHNSFGITGDGSSQYSNTFFTPSSIFTTTSGASIGVYTGSDSSQGDVYEIGSYNNPSKCLFLSVKNGGVSPISLFIGSYASIQSSTNMDARTDFSTQHESSGGNSAAVYKRGIYITNGATNSDPPPTVPIWLNAMNVNGTGYGYSNRTISDARINLPLTNNEHLAFYNARQAFHTANSRAI